MMVLSLLFGKKYAQSRFQDALSSLDLVVFDTMISETHRFNSRVTTYPVENGTIVSDHILKLPVTVSLAGFVTDTPLSFLNILASFNRSADAFNKLVNLYEDRTVFRVVTGLKVYENMTIVALDVPRTVKTGQTLTFNIELQQIIFSDVINTPLNITNVFVGTQTIRSNDIIAANTNIPILNNDPPNSLKDQASTNVNTGVQTPAPIPTATLPNVQTIRLAIAGINLL